MKLDIELKIRLAAVWACRIIAGATFIISGWAKAIDPWGFVIKTGEYLNVWGQQVPHEAVVAGCIALACIEFVIGILLITGSLKRSAAIAATAMMAFMLPLTAYIAIANPVSDCGCFGDLWHVSNTFTFIKNIFLTAAVYLLLRNRTVSGIYAPPIQWIVIAISLAFPLFLAMVGYQIQPLVDFRPYKVGTHIFEGENARGTETEEYIYQKNGISKAFTLDKLPDSTWTYVQTIEPQNDQNTFGGVISVRDNEGYEVNDILNSEYSRNIFLIVPEPDMHYLMQAHFLNRLVQWCERSNVGFCAVIGERGTGTDRWKDWIRPTFEVYTADASALKQLVRGREAIIYTLDGITVWKRTLSSIPRNLPDRDASAADILSVPDDGRLHTYALGIYLAAMAITYLLSLSPRILSFLTKISRRNK